jgi:dethiobiotin synthetase
MRYFVTAIGTDCGKTLASAILTQALGADYWKPVQAGFPRDTDTVRSLVTNKKTIFHDEAYLLGTPASPHAAAKSEGVDIRLEYIMPPYTERDLIIEGAGGILVPLNKHHFILDLIYVLDAEVILVADLYLGSINHTLLTVELLKKKRFKVKGIIFNGPETPESEELILSYSGYRCLLRIRPEAQINHSVINKYAMEILKNWNEQYDSNP